MEKIGLIAGNRRLPLFFAKAAKKRGYHLVAVAVKGEACPQLTRFVDKIYWLALSEFSRLFAIFKDEGIKEVAMAGQVRPGWLFSRQVSRDAELKKMLAAIQDKKADTIFGAIAAKLKENGLDLVSAVTFLCEFLPQKGTLGAQEPTSDQWQDIWFGLHLAKEIAALDIGQTVAIKNKAIVAIEALEGTDGLIRRAGRVARAGVTVVKVSKPNQDLRFDMPVVGLSTVKNLIRSRAACLAIEAGKTFFLDQGKSLALANKKRLAMVAV